MARPDWISRSPTPRHQRGMVIPGLGVGVLAPQSGFSVNAMNWLKPRRGQNWRMARSWG